MLSLADAALVERDRALRGLPVLLDGHGLSSWLGAPAHRRPSWLGAPAHRRYLRYKPGISCVLSASVSGQRIVVVAYADAAAPKLEKWLAKAPDGTVLAVDRNRLLMAALPAADRDLPALAALAHPGRGAALLARMLPEMELAHAQLRTLVHKPQRRWVGVLTPTQGVPVALRAHRPAEAVAVVEATRGLAAGSPRTPAVLASSAKLGLTAVEWLPGQPLDRALQDGAAGERELLAAGAALGLLHGRHLTHQRRRPLAEGLRDVEAAAEQVGILLPDLAARAGTLRSRIVRMLAAAPGPPVTVHGDFSLDQVVVDPQGRIALIDLDSVSTGEAALDIAGAVAALHAATVLEQDSIDVGACSDALQRGYAVRSTPPEDERLAVHTSAALLRRAAEPFRLCTPDWAAAVERLLTLAERAAP